MHDVAFVICVCVLFAENLVGQLANQSRTYPEENWPLVGGNWAGTRYSTLDEITAETIDRLLAVRLNTLPAKLMRRESIDMWILVAREYNEDPVVMTMLPGDAHAARRRTILVFSDEGDEGVKGYAVSRYAVGDYFQAIWNPEEQPDQWRALSDLITEKNPSTIGINVSSDFALADGLTHGEYEGLVDALTNEQESRLVSAEKLAIAWLETRTEEEMEIYPSIVEIAHDIIAEGFSNAVIKGNTSSLATRPFILP